MDILVSCGKFKINNKLELSLNDIVIRENIIAVNEKGDFIDACRTLYNSRGKKLSEEKFLKLSGNYALSVDGELYHISDFTFPICVFVTDILDSFIVTGCGADGHLAYISTNEFEKKRSVFYLKYDDTLFKINVTKLIHCEKSIEYVHRYLMNRSFFYLQVEADKKILDLKIDEFFSIVEISQKYELITQSKLKVKRKYKEIYQTIEFFDKEPCKKRKTAYVCLIMCLLKVEPKLPKPIVRMILAQCF